MVNYSRYCLRFISSYTVLSFTIQRLIIVYSPLKITYKRKIYAWYTILLIITITFLLNIWIFFALELRLDGYDNKACDIKISWVNIYYYISLLNVILITVIPVILIIICNGLIIIKSTSDDLKRKQILNQMESLTLVETDTSLRTFSIKRKQQTKSTKASVVSSTQQNQKSKSHAKKITFTLTLVSISYVILNLPYGILW